MLKRRHIIIFIKTKMLWDFQICIIVPLKSNFLAIKDSLFKGNFSAAHFGLASLAFLKLKQLGN